MRAAGGGDADDGSACVGVRVRRSAQAMPRRPVHSPISCLSRFTPPAPNASRTVASGTSTPEPAGSRTPVLRSRRVCENRMGRMPFDVIEVSDIAYVTCPAPPLMPRARRSFLRAMRLPRVAPAHFPAAAAMSPPCAFRFRFTAAAAADCFAASPIAATCLPPLIAAMPRRLRCDAGDAIQNSTPTFSPPAIRQHGASPPPLIRHAG